MLLSAWVAVWMRKRRGRSAFVMMLTVGLSRETWKMDTVNGYGLQFLAVGTRSVPLGRRASYSPHQRCFIMGDSVLARLTRTFTLCFTYNDDMPHHHIHGCKIPAG